VALGLMIGALISGWVLEIAGSRLTLLASLAIYGLAGTGGLFFKSAPLLLGACFVIGFTTSCMVTTCMWGIAAEYHGDRRAKALGTSTALSNVTSLIGIILGGYLARRGGWPLSFLQYPVFAVLAFALAFISISQMKPVREAVRGQRQPYFLRLLPLYLLAMFLFAVIFMGSTQFVFLLVDDGVTDPGTRSLIISTVTIVAAIASIGYGLLQLRLGLVGSFIVCLLSMAAGLATAALTSSITFAVLAAALIGVYAGLVVPYVYHVVTEHSDAYARSRAIGMLTAFAFLGGFTNPIIFSPLAKVIGLRNVFLAVAIVMTLLMIGTSIRHRRMQARCSGDQGPPAGSSI
jgi:MFS family permease